MSGDSELSGHFEITRLPDSGGGSDSNAGPIIGAIAGVAVILLIVLVILIFLAVM